MDRDAHLYTPKQISIHSLRMEGDWAMHCRRSSVRFYFNPLPPYGGRRYRLPRPCSWQLYFNPLPPYGGRPPAHRRRQPVPRYFNPLPPYGGRRHVSAADAFGGAFQSTPSVWRETHTQSPHEYVLTDFNPLPPYGGRLCGNARQTDIMPFQSTPSVWRETAKLHRKAFFISPILVQSCKKGCKRLHSAPEKMIFFEKREKNSVRNLQHLSVRL